MWKRKCISLTRIRSVGRGLHLKKVFIDRFTFSIVYFSDFGTIISFRYFFGCQFYFDVIEYLMKSL